MWGTTPAWLPTHSAQSSVGRPPSSLDVGGTDVNPGARCSDAACRISRALLWSASSCMLNPATLQRQLGQITNGVKSAVCEWPEFITSLGLQLLQLKSSGFFKLRTLSRTIVYGNERDSIMSWLCNGGTQHFLFICFSFCLFQTSTFSHQRRGSQCM